MGRYRKIAVRTWICILVTVMDPITVRVRVRVRTIF